MPDAFSQSYQVHLEGLYDCVDRIVLNGHFMLGQTGGGFRTWWRRLKGSDEQLDDRQLAQFAGRFSRRIHAYAKKKGIPLIHCRRGERKHEIADRYHPSNPNFKGVFCIVVGLAPAPIFHVQRFKSGAINLIRQTPYPYVNQYSFYILDPEWGRLTIKLCPYPPFNAQIVLNGHEYVARQAQKAGLDFTKEENCFTEVTDAAGLARVAHTLKDARAAGRLVRVCERWIYSSCLCFALDLSEQKSSGFHYDYSVYQAEYSRNLIFNRGRILDQVFHSLIDRTRGLLNLKTVKTILGFKHRPYYRHRQGDPPRFEVTVERPVYDLTIFKIHFGKLTVKMYSKGARVLRIETIIHNTKQLNCGRGIQRLPQIVVALQTVMERFLESLSGIDVSFIDNGTLESWPRPSTVGATRVGGVDVNQTRTRAVMEAIITLAINPRGFVAADLAAKVREILAIPDTRYQARQASYDLKKFRGKDLVHLFGNSHRYLPTPKGLKSMTAFLVLREKILIPLLAGVENLKPLGQIKNLFEMDRHYHTIQNEMQALFEINRIAA